MAEETKVEIIDPWTQTSKGFEQTTIIESIPPILADQSYGKFNETIDGPQGIRNLSSGWIGKNWAYSFVNSNGSGTGTVVLPLWAWFNGWGVVTNDTGNNAVKVTSAGLYHISAMASVGLTTWLRIYASVRINGTDIGLSQYFRNPSSTSFDYYPINISGIWYLNANDLITFIVYSDWTIDYSQQDINSDWTIGTYNNTQGWMLQVYKL